MICFAVMLISGCAQQQTAVKKRFFWPALPDEPKIEWVGAYSSSLDLKVRNSLFSALAGEDDEIRINRPLFVAGDGKGKVYVTSASGQASIFDFNKGEIEPLGSDALAGALGRVTGITVDDQDNIYVADSASRKIHVVNSQNKPIKVLDLSGQLESIGYIAFDRANKRLVVPDVKGNKIVVCDQDGKVLLILGKPVGAEGGFNRPNAVAVEKDGTIIVADSFNAQIKRFTSQGVFINTFGKRGDGNMDFALIKGVAVDSEDHIYVSDGKASKIMIFTGKGEPLFTFGAQQQQTEGAKLYIAGFNLPQGISIDQNDRIYVADQLNDRFQIFQYINPRYLAEFPIDRPQGDAVK